jgi:hypothetical protein
VVWQYMCFPSLPFPSLPLTFDGAVHAGQPLARDPPLPQHAPVVVNVPGLQEADVGLPNGHVLGGGVLVQLLVPLLQERLVMALEEEEKSRGGGVGRENQGTPGKNIG